MTGVFETKMKLKTIIPISAILFLQGCVNPVITPLDKIAREPFIRDVNDCSNKAGELFRELDKVGYDVEVIRGVKSGFAHGFVRLRIRGEQFYLDATTGKVSRQLTGGYEFGNVVPRNVLYSQGGEWGKRE